MEKLHGDSHSLLRDAVSVSHSLQVLKVKNLAHARTVLSLCIFSHSHLSGHDRFNDSHVVDFLLILPVCMEKKETTHTHPEGLVKSQNDVLIQRGFELRIALEKNSYYASNKHSHGFLRYVYLKNTRMGFPLLQLSPIWKNT
jgi:hypothetical protein